MSVNVWAVLAVAIGLFLAFRLGSRHRANKRAWTDYRTTRTLFRSIGNGRWLALRAFIGALVLVVLFIAIVIVAGFHLADRLIDDSKQANTPASTAPATHHPSPKPSKT
jgi:hypothetical protein